MAGVRVRLRPAQAVVDVHRRDRVAELAEHVPEAGRVGAAGDEAADLAAGRDQVVLADEPLDALGEVGSHARIVTSRGQSLTQIAKDRGSAARGSTPRAARRRRRRSSALSRAAPRARPASHERRGNEAVGRIEHVADRERVADDERTLLGPLEQRTEPARVARGGLRAALASARRLERRRLGPRPRAVLDEQPAVEASEVDLVQLGNDDRAARRARRARARASPACAGARSRRRDRGSPRRGSRPSPRACSTPSSVSPSPGAVHAASPSRFERRARAARGRPRLK